MVTTSISTLSTPLVNSTLSSETKVRFHTARTPKSLNINSLRRGQGAGGREQPFWWGEVLHPDVSHIKPLDHHESALQVTLQTIFSSGEAVYNCDLFNIWHNL